VSHTSRLSAALLLTLAACQPTAPDPNAVERIDLDAQAEQAPLTGGLPSAADAGWELAPDNKSLRFANPAGEPLLSLACELPRDAAPRIRFIQFADAPPGAKALFALVGNGMVARIDMDARVEGDRWLWRGSMPADAFKLDVLTGDREVIATMPGGGEITLPPSPLPRQLVEWCRQQAKPVELSPGPTASPEIPPPE
jgi:hypothetical protein